MLEEERKEKKRKNKRTILAYMREKGAIQVRGNTFYAEKAFMINSVLTWCIERCDDGIFTPDDLGFYFDSLNQYILGQTSISWSESGDLVIGG